MIVLVPFPCASLHPTRVKQDGGAAALEETALSFTGAIALGSVCCCTTMSCVALCIKCLSWMFGYRGRRRVLARPQIGQDINGRRTYTAVDDIAEQRQNGVLHTSEIELPETSYRNIEEQRSSGNRDTCLDRRSEATTANGSTMIPRSKEPKALSSSAPAGDDGDDEEQDSGRGRLGG